MFRRFPAPRVESGTLIDGVSRSWETEHGHIHASVYSNGQAYIHDNRFTVEHQHTSLIIRSESGKEEGINMASLMNFSYGDPYTLIYDHNKLTHVVCQKSGFRIFCGNVFDRAFYEAKGFFDFFRTMLPLLLLYFFYFDFAEPIQLEYLKDLYTQYYPESDNGFYRWEYHLDFGLALGISLLAPFFLLLLYPTYFWNQIYKGLLPLGLLVVFPFAGYDALTNFLGSEIGDGEEIFVPLVSAIGLLIVHHIWFKKKIDAYRLTYQFLSGLRKMNL